MINYNSSINKYSNIVIDRESIEKLIKAINDFVNGTSQQLDYMNFERDFYFHIIPNKATRSKVFNEMEDHMQRYYKEIIEEIENTPEQYRLLFMVDDCKYQKGLSTGTGLSYLLLTTKKQLEDLANEMNRKYASLFGEKNE